MVLDMMEICVLLNGCGHRDGSEIQEAVLSMLAIEEAGARVTCIAPMRPQARTINHVTGSSEAEVRSMFVESARIARGRIEDIRKVNASMFDGLLIPGGSGTAANLCNFASAGASMEVDPDVARLLTEFHKAKKPIGAVCIAPILLARLFGSLGARLTLGDASGAAARAASSWGCLMIDCGPEEICADADRLFISTPAYMHDASLLQISQGIRKLGHKLVDWAKAAASGER